MAVTDKKQGLDFEEEFKTLGNLIDEYQLLEIEIKKISQEIENITAIRDTKEILRRQVFTLFEEGGNNDHKLFQNLQHYNLLLVKLEKIRRNLSEEREKMQKKHQQLESKIQAPSDYRVFI